MSFLYELDDTSGLSANIKVIGVGGGGGNALNNMIAQNLAGVEFIVANTDAQAIEKSKATTRLHLGAEYTRGLGAGADPNIGREAAASEKDRIRELLQGADMAFITAGMGGGTGTGAAPVIAEVAREMDILTVAVVTKPFGFEGKRRMRQAEAGIEELRKHVDTLITIPNQKLIAAVGKNTALMDAFRKADDVLLQAVKGISDLIANSGYINVDFADVKSVMSENRGMAMMGSGSMRGENRAIEAAEQAISSPLLEDVDIHGARGILVNVTGSSDMTLHEVTEAVSIIENMADEDANIIFGWVNDDSMGDEMRVTVVATGLNQTPAPKLASSKDAAASKLPFQKFGAPVSPQIFTTDYSGYDTPTVARTAEKAVNATAYDEEQLSIPTWIRRQAD
ncbi:MAG: cell division protein FtsZ [Zetaproteobacteria bacterium CG_4_9_14_3_um_filter_49_83]|nr:MAG: cell division protein FtsZ [Zetaproteobacteria bacterium CG1_02_49_23]PIQ34450.1 MAG: cell division protein FtsZ [Zetaproteobacteria bacterium CG17_big_fil_post_rev_8_21_14_2_50_50_13]PIV29059.1 MAG: cell division protein FtsZ [Zetaproteobacteria bacterium CG02_land_8_20_14_3_00_50_9]PIY56433.1 MAG: cell division protein FtsZ [Zetaproteobacteria bacterium CG_4_10_14_0_8_um_filter_49_80]PJA34072.1 MAG: cell division protein FtsZ [Zetaproteobacteria bacterium CG_4_9_14_3_um_filter_49_83]